MIYQIQLRALPTLTFHYQPQQFHSLTLDLLNSPLTDESLTGLFFTELWNRRALFLLDSVINKRPINWNSWHLRYGGTDWQLSFMDVERQIPDQVLRQALRELVDSCLACWQREQGLTGHEMVALEHRAIRLAIKR